MNKTFEKLGFYPADILLPKDQDMTKWAVVACDQFTSEPEYWQAVEQTVGDAPSTLRLILPEANLKAPNVDEFIADINAGTYAQLVEAAENCQVAIIHPGKPRNPNEPGLEDLIKRAEAFL